MSKTLDQLNAGLQAFERSPDGIGMQFRLDLARIIWDGLRRKGWSQGQLAKQAGLEDSVISNLIHGNNNCTLDTVGRVIHALGTSAVLIETRGYPASATDSFWASFKLIDKTVDRTREDLKSEQTKIDIQSGIQIEATG